MSVLKEEFTFPSVVGDADIHAVSWKPDGPVKAVLQLVHGMAEYIDRYDGMARWFAERGIAVYGNDHLGHGLSVNDKYPLGYFGTKNEKGFVFRDDVKKLTDIAKEQNPGLPVILFGHSMGSFIARTYIAEYGAGLKAAVICGTAGPNPAIGAAKAATALFTKTSPKKGGKVMNSLAFGTYNKKTDKRTAFDWLSIDETNIDKYIADPLCGFLFSNQGFRDLITLNDYMVKPEVFDGAPADLPIFLIAGDEDPVGAYGTGVQQTYDAYKEGHSDVTMKLYEGKRHEIHNEVDGDVVYQDVLDFIEAKAL
ncbi:MAG: lysophospholipase [Clostridia bacterium]|nr:lysophospholipase [Clostridia bacterium]